VRILLAGRTGQVGSELLRTLPALGEVLAPERAALDLSNLVQLREAVRSAKPAVIVNAAAHTAVDAAESDRDAAYAVNATAPGVLAEEARRAGALLVHYSTDYVFDGAKAAPYVESDPAAPINAYGATKLAGERAIGASGCRHVVLRTSWVYAERGRNFMLTMLRLARKASKPLRVVDDQTGAPTSAQMIAAGTAATLRLALAGNAADGVYHMSAQGAVTWYGFARAIFLEAGVDAEVVPITSSEYPTAARRPKNSLLDNSKLASLGVRLPAWQEGLRDVLSRSGAPKSL
jgi:dTDP-4-dehydrorhamnose reductase